MSPFSCSAMHLNLAPTPDFTKKILPPAWQIFYRDTICIYDFRSYWQICFFKTWFSRMLCG